MEKRTLLKAAGISLVSGLMPQTTIAANLSCEEDIRKIVIMFEVEYQDDKIQSKRDDIQAMNDATAGETGCLSYTSSFDINNPHILRVHQIWDYMDAFRQHLSTPHAIKYQEALYDLAVVRMDASVYELGDELPYPN